MIPGRKFQAGWNLLPLKAIRTLEGTDRGAGMQLVALAHVTTGSSPITVGVMVGDPTMEGMATWVTGIRIAIMAAM